ncbi:MAG: ComEA family DNA-binding protein [Candidatus Nanopelagicales bacterium]|nr:ComEA family DNA-binding protein [Candidatus Nanopelagicales bacterium]MDZ4250477.1 ComEA family DNA-binding protein [Candidatus Nanopelagicales bacterium]
MTNDREELRLQPLPRRRRLPDWSSVRGVVAMSVVAMGLAAWWWSQGRAEPNLTMTAQSVESASLASGQPSTTEPPPGPELLVTSPATPASTAQESATPTGAASATPGSQTGGVVVVDVRGAVRRPGLQRLPDGSRVADAIEAAGGLRPGRHFGPVNLAQILTDGQQVIVGRGWTPATSPASAPSTAASPSAVIDINRATATELEDLPGVGPVLAARIVEWRTANGPFRSVDDLLEVSGIGDATLASMRSKLSVG